jgi:hypothetical protein
MEGLHQQMTFNLATVCYKFNLKDAKSFFENFETRV